jgi:hypothetical protein
LSGILGDRATVETTKFAIPTSLDPQISFLQTVQGLLVSASGGVMIESWHVATTTTENETVAAARSKADQWNSSDSWFQ